MVDKESSEIELTPQQKIGKVINAWATNTEGIDAGNDSDGNTKKKIFDLVEGYQNLPLTDKQKTALEEIKEMSFSTGIDPSKIRQLVEHFIPPNEDKQT